MEMTTPLTDEDPVGAIEVFADVTCPFAHVSLRRLQPLRDGISPRSPLVVRAWPLELVNGEPLDPCATARHVEELRRDVAPELFSGFRMAAMPRSTLKALALVEAANERDPWLGERVSLHLRDLLFEQGERLDDAVLAGVAGESGLDVAVLDETYRVRSRLEQGRRRGVQGSPHIFIGDRGLFCPLLDMESDASGGLQVQERLSRLEGFLRDGLVSSR